MQHWTTENVLNNFKYTCRSRQNKESIQYSYKKRKIMKMYNTHTKSTQNNENIQYTYKKSQNKNIQYSYKKSQNKNIQYSYKNRQNKEKKNITYILLYLLCMC
jgi:hypothetical protein